MNAAVGMAQYEDRFDGTTSSNWSRETLLNRGSAEWSISGGRMNFFTGSSPTSDNQVLIKYQNPFSNSQDWSFQIGMNNASTAQLQVFVGNANYSDYFGVTLKGYANGSRVWGAEFPGHQYWVPPSGIMATASQQGSIKVDYASSTGTYSLFYANGGMDPISNSYSWTLLNSYVTSERGNVDFYAGINTGETVANGQAYVDNFKAIPEPSVLSLGMLGLAGLVMLRSRRRILVMVAISAIFFLDREANATLTLYETVDPSLSHQLITVQNSPYVNYTYKISLNLTTLNDWLVFLNSKAQTSDPYNLFKASDFSRSLSNGTFTHSLLNVSAGNNPVRNINLYDAYRYANWIENGANQNSSTETGAYNLINLSIENNDVSIRSSSSKYFIQTDKEWYGALGNINTQPGYYEWTDAKDEPYSDSPLYMYAYHEYEDGGIAPITYFDVPSRETEADGEISFRIASVPEPSALSLLAIGLSGLALVRRRRS